jgi:type II secretory pathway pseudopilin PulG
VAARCYENYKTGIAFAPKKGPMLSFQHSAQRGSTLIEATIAAGISAIFLSSLFTMNSSTMQTIKMARETACASQVLQQRIEAMRIANWHQITDANWIQANLLNTDAAGSNGLKNFSETLTLIPYGSSSTSTTELTRANGSATIVTQNSALLTESAVKLIWTVNFTGAPNERNSTRQTVAILAKGGVAKW